jgi:hypothetical protein
VTDFDGDPARIDETQIDATGAVIDVTTVQPEPPAAPDDPAYTPGSGAGGAISDTDDADQPRKYYIDGGVSVEILAHYAYELDAQGKQLSVVKYADYTAETMRTLYPSAAILNELLDKYAAHGVAQFVVPDVLKVLPISDRGNVGEIVRLFGGVDALKAAVAELQGLLYAA